MNDDTHEKKALSLAKQGKRREAMAATNAIEDIQRRQQIRWETRLILMGTERTEVRQVTEDEWL